MAKRKRGRHRGGKAVKRSPGNKVAASINPVPAPVISAMDEQLEAFREKFGRDPGPDDPVIFDPDADEPQPVDPDQMFAQMVVTMIHAEVRPALIYAYIRTGGMILTEDNEHMWAEEELARYEAAMQEYDTTFVNDATS